MAHTRTRILISLAAVALAFSPASPAAAQAPRVKTPVPFSSLSKEQLAKLGDNDPIEFHGKVTTKSALLAPLRTARVDSDAELKIKLAQAASKLQTLKARSATLQRAQVDKSKALLSGELAKLRVAPTPAPKPTPCAGPVVAGVIGLVTPNSDVLVLGHCFGTQQGTASLQGGFGNVSLIVIEWHDGGIGLHVPSTLQGGPDQLGFEGAQIVIATAGGQSPPVPPRVDFHAAREHRILEAHEVKTQCSIGADINNCDPTVGRTLDAAHSNTVDVTSDNGNDVISGNLKNGWVIVDQTVTRVSKGNFISPCDGGYDAIPAQPTGNFALHYSFSVSPFQYCRTVVLLYAEGPVGTSPH